jgi:putative Mg2+ transporter-C (MgtC) family protein
VVDTAALTMVPSTCSRNFLSSQLSLHSNCNKVRSVRDIRTAFPPLSRRKNIPSKGKESDSLTDSQWKNLFQRFRFKLSKNLALRLGVMLLLPLKALASTVVAETVAPEVAGAAVTVVSAASPVAAAVEFQLTLRLIYAALLGAGLGMERAISKHSAGVRTMALVAMGASAFTVCSAYGFSSTGDPSRMASNVASGVGFVGAGVITTTHFSGRNIVHGLTTASTIWLSAAVGVACGTGLYQIATMAAALTIFILRLGRTKPKNEAEVSSSSAEAQIEKQVLHAGGVNDDEEDIYAETHDTSVYDEHHRSVQNLIDDERPDHYETQQEEKKKYVVEMASERIQSGTSTGLVQKDHIMEEMAMNVWNNATQQQVHIANMERFSKAAVNKTVYGP